MIEIPIVALSVLSGFAAVGFATLGFFLAELAQRMAVRAWLAHRRWRRR